MTTKLKLSARKRVATGKGAARKLRTQGMIPAIVYGNRKENLPICFNTNDFIKLVHGAAHENMIFELNLEGNKGGIIPNVIIKQIQVNPLKGNILHVDFYEISMEQALQVHVPLELLGDSIGVKEEGGLLDFVSRELLIECLPKDLPETIQIDVTQVKLGESLHVKDINFTQGVKPLENPEKVILSIIHKLKGKEEIVTEAVVEEEQEPEVLMQKSEK